MQLVPGKVQKVSVVNDDIVIELFAGSKCFLVLAPGRASVVVDKPAGNDGTPPAVQGLLRKEMQPSILTAVSDDDDAGAVARYVFARKDLPPCTIVVEKDGNDPRWILVSPAKDGSGERILAAGPATRSHDGRDLRRGRLYEPPRAKAAPMPAPTTTKTAPTSTLDAPTATLLAALKRELDRKKRLIKALEGDLKKHGDPARLEEDGELLKTVMGQVARGATSMDVTAFDGSARTLTLDPSKDARQNLAAFFARAKRGKTAALHVAPRIDETRALIASIEDVRAALAAGSVAGVVDAAVVARAEALLREGGPAPRRKAAMATAGKEGKRKAWRAFQVGDVVVRVGRGARDNDALVKASKGNDLWLHTRDATGAHVVVASNGGPVEDGLVRDAALLAVWFSTQRGERTVMVQHTRVKNLKKPGAGAPAGLWIVGQETVLALRVDDDRTAQLLKSEVAA